MMASAPGYYKTEPNVKAVYSTNIGEDPFNGLLHDKGDLTRASVPNLNCTRCGTDFELNEPIVNCGGKVYKVDCFVCAQCFRPFPDGIFYEFEGRNYCEHCWHVLYAPCCKKCGEFIVGRVIKAMNASWHPRCFTCELCGIELADIGFLRNKGRALCRDCNAKETSENVPRFVCRKSGALIPEGQHIKFRGDAYFPHYFNCTSCGVELTPTAREVRGELYCLKCHDRMGIPICAATHKPIEGRVVTALGKQWSVENFCCAHCGTPFMGSRFYEKNGKAYRPGCYQKLFGDVCFMSGKVIEGDVVRALCKTWSEEYFCCFLCNRKMTQKSKFYELDMKPVCKRCFEKLPQELKKRLSKSYNRTPKKAV